MRGLLACHVEASKTDATTLLAVYAATSCSSARDWFGEWGSASSASKPGEVSQTVLAKPSGSLCLLRIPPKKVIGYASSH